MSGLKTDRLKPILWVFGIALFLLFARLFQLQVLEGETWKEEALRSRLHRRSIPATRGTITDREGRVLARDRAAFDLMFEYRAFRRSQPSAQLLEAYALLGNAPGGLDYCLLEGEKLGEDLFRIHPQAFSPLTHSEKKDLLFYLARLGGMINQKEISAWAEKEDATFSQRFPQSFDFLKASLESQRRAIFRLEESLGHPWPAGLLHQLEQERQALENRIRLQAVRVAAGRGFEKSAFEVREVLTEMAPDISVPRLVGVEKQWESKLGTQFMADIVKRWKWPRSSQSLAELLLADGDPATLAFRLGQLLRHIERVQPADLFGVRRALVREIHQNRVIRLRGDIPYEAVDRLARLPETYAGLYIEENPRRVYPHGGAPHLVGLVRSADEKDLQIYQELREEYRGFARLLSRSSDQENRYRLIRKKLFQEVIRPGETRGRNGVELAFEGALRGGRGYLQILDAGEMNARPLELDFVAPKRGNDIRMALQMDLMEAAEDAVIAGYQRARLNLIQDGRAAEVAPLKNRRVGFAIIDLIDDSLPVLVTTPTYSVEEYRTNYASLVARREAGPLRHRALGGGFQGHQAPYPGSTFKLVVAAEALAQNPAAWDEERECHGSWGPPGSQRPLWCDYRAGHGRLAMREAIQRSCNVYFYQVGWDLGYAAVWDRARKLGFGAPTGQELAVLDSRQGRVVDMGSGAWLERGANDLIPPHKVKNLLAPLHLAIGQGYITASPLQMARLFGWLATGSLPVPRLVLDGAGASPALPPVEKFVFATELREKLQSALRAVVNEPQGTAFHNGEVLRDFRVAGKTGTAQVGGGENHAWFAGYYPWDQPRYAVAVFCENAGLHGGEIATLVLAEYLKSPAARKVWEGLGQ